jgi:hypothetical protein
VDDNGYIPENNYMPPVEEEEEAAPQEAPVRQRRRRLNEMERLAIENVEQGRAPRARRLRRR